MIRCHYCGVELEENANFCSLCGEPLLETNTDKSFYLKLKKIQQEKKLLTDYQKLTAFQKRKLFWKISAIIFVSGIIITLIINLAGNHALTWSKYPITASMVLFINITLITFWHKKLRLLLSFSFLSTSVLLILLDIYTGNNRWGTQLGMPLLFAVYVILFVFIQLEKILKQKGLNIIAYSLITSGLLCICIDGIISIYTKNLLNFEWSLIVMVSALIISALLLYIHHRLKKVTDLKRFFHI